MERELFANTDQVPEKHNLTYFPTVNDLQNHIHQAVKDIQTGVLQLNTTTVSDFDIIIQSFIILLGAEFINIIDAVLNLYTLKLRSSCKKIANVI